MAAAMAKHDQQDHGMACRSNGQGMGGQGGHPAIDHGRVDGLCSGIHPVEIGRRRLTA